MPHKRHDFPNAGHRSRPRLCGGPQYLHSPVLLCVCAGELDALLIDLRPGRCPYARLMLSPGTELLGDMDFNLLSNTSTARPMSTAPSNLRSFSLSMRHLAPSSVIPITSLSLMRSSPIAPYSHVAAFSLSLVTKASTDSPSSCLKFPKTYFSKIMFLVGVKYYPILSSIAPASFCSSSVSARLCL